MGVNNAVLDTAPTEAPTNSAMPLPLENALSEPQSAPLTADVRDAEPGTVTSRPPKGETLTTVVAAMIMREMRKKLDQRHEDWRVSFIRHATRQHR